MVGPGVALGVAVLAASAGGCRLIKRRRTRSASFADKTVRVARLSDLQLDPETLGAIQSSLREEWGSFALLGFDNIEQMAADCGGTVFVAYLEGAGGITPLAVLQTTSLDIAGDPSRLAGLFPTFADLTTAEALRRGASVGGDTVVLLQITVIDKDMRRGGLGSQLRNEALEMLNGSIKYALTTTPIDVNAEEAVLALQDPETFTGAMRFHARGGAEPTIRLPGYKQALDEETSQHSNDVVVMRYSRNQDGSWGAGGLPVQRGWPDRELGHRIAAATSGFVTACRISLLHL
jgi:hypothetical protein